MFHNALKALKEEIIFFCSWVFLEADHSGKIGKTKIDTYARVAGRIKKRNKRKCEKYFNGSQ